MHMHHAFFLHAKHIAFMDIMYMKRILLLGSGSKYYFTLGLVKLATPHWFGGRISPSLPDRADVRAAEELWYIQASTYGSLTASHLFCAWMEKEGCHFHLHHSLCFCMTNIYKHAQRFFPSVCRTYNARLHNPYNILFQYIYIFYIPSINNPSPRRSTLLNV